MFIIIMLDDGPYLVELNPDFFSVLDDELLAGFDEATSEPVLPWASQVAEA